MAAGRFDKSVSMLLGFLKEQKVAAAIATVAAMKPFFTASSSSYAPYLDMPALTSTVFAPRISPSIVDVNAIKKISQAIVEDFYGKLSTHSGEPVKALFISPGTIYNRVDGIYPEVTSLFEGLDIPVRAIDGVGTNSVPIEITKARIAESEDPLYFNYTMLIDYPIAWALGIGIDGVAAKIKALYHEMDTYINENHLEHATVGIFGHSRGCIIAIEVINLLKEKYPDLKIEFLAIDPVAGPMERQTYHLTEKAGVHLTVVRNIGETKVAYPPAELIEGLPGQITTLYRPGIHGAGINATIFMPDSVITLDLLRATMSCGAVPIEHAAYLEKAVRADINAHCMAAPATRVTPRHLFLENVIRNVIAPKLRLASTPSVEFA